MAEPPPLRIALGLGDQELEQRLRPALDADPHFDVAVHCLAADHVLAAIEGHDIDAVVLGWSLHRLSESILAQLEAAGVPIVVLTPERQAARWRLRRTVLLPPDAEPDALRVAVAAARAGIQPAAPAPRPITAPPKRSASETIAAASPMSVLAIAGGAGSPGRTTVAINLATALGSVVPTVLVDLDFTNPCVAAYLNRDPSRNVCTLAHAVRDTTGRWAAAFGQELQPLHPRSPHGMLLCGLPKREMRSSVTPEVVERLLGELTTAFRYVVVDVGAEVLGLDHPAVGHRAVLAAAQHVLLVTGPDLVSLWHTRTLIGQLERNQGIARERISLVTNRHDPRYHHARAEIEWHLGVASAAVIPNDYAALQRAVADQYPVVTDASSRAAQAIIALAERIHDGRVRLLPPRTESDGAASSSGFSRGLSELASRLLPSRPRNEP